MKKNNKIIILASILLVYLLVYVFFFRDNNTINDNSDENTDIVETNDKDEIESVVETEQKDINFKYSGISNKVFLYDKDSCDVDTDSKIKNGDVISVECNGIKKDVEISGLYEDDINDKKIKSIMNKNLIGNAESYHVKPNAYGFDIMILKKQPNDEYKIELFYNYFVDGDYLAYHKGNVEEIDNLNFNDFESKFSKGIRFDEIPAVISDIKEKYIENLIKDYKDKGFIEMYN